MNDHSVSSFYEQHNPWIGDDRSVIALRNSLLLAEKTGHLRKNDEQSIQRQEKIARSPSVLLIRLQKEISAKKTEINKLRLEIHRRMLDNETSDLTHSDVLEKKIEKLKILNNHMQSITSNKDQLISRLQQPFVGDYIKMDAVYHRHASDLFPLAASGLADLNAHLENISWAKSIHFTEAQLDNLLLDLTSVLASLQTHFQGLCQLRQNMEQLSSSYQQTIVLTEHNRSSSSNR